MRREYNKLVRDKIPEIIERNGDKAIVRVLDDEEYKKELLKKLIEEATEVKEAGSNKKEIVKEIGDVLEVIDYITSSFQLEKKEIEKIKTTRKEERGGFKSRIFLEYTE